MEVAMKALKFVLIALLVALTLMSLASAEGFKSKPGSKKIVNTTFEKAVLNPGLLAAMYEQTDREEFLQHTQPFYIAEVTFESNIYHIRGTREQWIFFFRMKGETRTQNDLFILL
jgi:hypothetical protein